MGTLFEDNKDLEINEATAISTTETDAKAKRHRRTKEEVETARKEEAAALLGIKTASDNGESSPADALMQNNRLALLRKLHSIQTKCLGFVKDSWSQSADGKSFKYASGNQVLGMIRPLMDEMGLILVPEAVSAATSQVDEQKTDNKGVSAWVKSTLFTVNLNFVWIDVESGASIKCPFVGAGCNGLDQGLGSAYTYAERYFLLKFFHIPTDEDDLDALHRALKSASIAAAAAPTPALAVQVVEEAKDDSAAAEAAKTDEPEKPKKVRKGPRADKETALNPEAEEAIAQMGKIANEAKAEAKAEAEKEAKAEVKPEEAAPSESEPSKEDKPAVESAEKAEPVVDSLGRELSVSAVEEGPSSKPVLEQGNPFWYKVTMRLFGMKGDKDAIKSELAKDYTFTDETFEALYAEIA